MTQARGVSIGLSSSFALHGGSSVSDVCCRGHDNIARDALVTSRGQPYALLDPMDYYATVTGSVQRWLSAQLSHTGLPHLLQQTACCLQPADLPQSAQGMAM